MLKSLFHHPPRRPTRHSSLPISRSRILITRLPRLLYRSQHTSAICDTPYEENTLLRFYEKRYCPIFIGQTLNDRYRIITKLGYGACSTVWLARDLIKDEYKSIKAFVRDESDASPVKNEIKIFQHIETCSKEETGAQLARFPEATFEEDGHTCLVTRPMACSLQQLQDLLTSHRIPREILMMVVLRLLFCVNWLHLECGVVHTEITPQNILMTGDNPDAIFQRAEQEERDNPSVPFFDYTHPHPRPVYHSRGHPTNIWEAYTGSLLGDFGSARLLKPPAVTSGWWMPDTYRAPEVLMSLPWDHAVDIWCIGVMVLELLEGRTLFHPIDHAHNQYVLPLALAQYIGFMGLPPLWMIQQSAEPAIKTFFDEQGAWIADVPIPETSFEEFITVVPPGEEKTRLLKFVRKIFTWSPAERAHSAGLFEEDEWLREFRKEAGLL